MPVEHEPLSGPLDRRELANDGSVRGIQPQRRAEAKRIRPGSHPHPVGSELYPGHDRAVIRTQRQLHSHRYAPLKPLHDAHELRGTTAPVWHEVDYPRGAVRGFEIRLEHECPLAVAP